MNVASRRAFSTSTRSRITDAMVAHAPLCDGCSAPSHNVANSWSCATDWYRLSRAYCSVATAPNGSQSTGAKLTASAQLKPVLNPAWYAYGNVMMYDRGCCSARYTGMPSSRKTFGERIVTSE